MPKLSKPKLVVHKTSSEQMARVVVTGTVKFNADELEAMRKGRQYKLKCKLKGADSGLNFGDDFLFAMQPKHYPADGHGAEQPFTFDQPVAVDLLDEDDGTDDVYARLILRDLSTHATVHQRNSNEWNQDF